MMTFAGKLFSLAMVAAAATAVLFASPAMAYERAPQKTAIVLAAFGTTDVEALEAILNVEKKVKAAFPDYDVHLAFTSNIIRHKWHQRANDQDFKKNNRVPEELYSIKNPLTVLALIQEGGSRDIFVQSLHITNGSEYDDQKKVVTQLAGIGALQESKKPFPYLAYGDSALGDGKPEQLERAAKALAPLVEMAKADKAALVLMGHGNDHIDVKSYRDFEATMKKMYDYPVFMGLVEGKPEFDDVLKGLKEAKMKTVLLAPFMLVAGDHAKNDLDGDEEDSWRTVLTKEGYTVKSHIQGLGLIDSWADIYVERLKKLDENYKKHSK